MTATKSELQSTLMDKMKKQTVATRHRLEKLGGKPSRSLLSPAASMGYMERLLHWTSETPFFKEEVNDWRLFWAWLKKFKNADPTNKGQ